MQKLKPFAEAEIEKKQLTASASEETFITERPMDVIKAILDDFQQRGWLSDARFTEQMVHARKSKFGSARVANELKEKGVADDLIAAAVVAIKETEFENALAICQKKYAAPPTSREDWARQARFLQSRGFTFELIKKVLNSKHEDHDAE